MPERPGRSQPFSLGGFTVAPGKRAHLDIPFVRLPTGTMQTLPVTILNGPSKGPTVWISAAVHGDEVGGVEIIRRVCSTLQPRYMRGTLVAMPIVNVFGFTNQIRYLPDRRDLNRVFPGSDRGSLASRLAHIFMDQVVKRCELGIDLHTAARDRVNLPHVRVDPRDAKAMELAMAFGAPVVLPAEAPKGSLRYAAQRLNIPVLTYEGGEALRFDEAALETGTRGVLHTLAAMGMVAQNGNGAIAPVVAMESTWLRAPRSGILHLTTQLGAQVTKGDTIAVVLDAQGKVRASLKTKQSGQIICVTVNPLVHQGDAVAHLAVADA